MQSANMVSGIIMLFSMAFVMAVAYVVLSLVSAKAKWRTFYCQLKPNRFAFIEKNGEITGVIYNSADYKLVDEPGYPFGMFVERRITRELPDGTVVDEGEDPRPELQQLDWYEKLTGLRFVGVPFIHSLHGEKLSWINVDNVKDFRVIPEQMVWDFAISRTYGFILRDLTLGTDRKEEEKSIPGIDKKEKDPDDKRLQRIPVLIKLLSQALIRDPHKAIITRIWKSGVEAKLSPCLQSELGTMSQDELIALKKAPRANKRNQIVQAIIDNLDEIQVFGADLIPETITYIDYEIDGDDDQKKAVHKANTTRFVKSQEAAGIRDIKTAEQADMEEQRRIVMATLQDVKRQYPDMSDEKAMDFALALLKTKSLTSTGLGAYVEGGGGGSSRVGLNIDSKDNRGKNKGGKQ